MKTKMKILFCFFFLGLVVVGCNKDHLEEAVINEPVAVDPVGEAEPGYLSLKATLKEVIDITTGKPPLDDVLSGMRIYISDGFEEIYTSAYNEAPETIELPVGFYNLLIAENSFYFGLNSRFDNGKYGYFNSSVSVNAGAITTINANLALFDVATTINISTEVANAYPDIVVNVLKWTDYYGIYENEALTWTTVESGRTGYFMTWFGDWLNATLGDTGGDLEISITATNNSGITVTASKWYLGVSANEHYNISIEQNGNTKGLNLIVTLDDEVIIDDIITFPS